MRKQLIATLILFLLGHAGVTDAAAVRLGSETQVFVDDVRVASKSGVRRRIHPARKLPHPVVEPEKPWEGNRVYLYGTIHFDPAAEEFRMWYESHPATGTRDKRLNRTRGVLVNYATSPDGIHWIKPELGLYSFCGSKQNNIIWDSNSHSVIVDRMDGDPTRRYKMAGLGHGSVWIAFSQDGIHWRDYKSAIFKSGDTLTWTRNPYNGEYMIFHKIVLDVRGSKRRSVFLSTSKDLQSWTPSKLALAADEVDDAWVKKPGERTDIYDMSVFPYGGQFLGIAATFRRTKRVKSTVPHQSVDKGTIHGQLVHSRDGHRWHRFEDRTPVLPNGPAKYDAGCILGMANAPVIHNDQIWLYYTGITTGHGGAMPEKRITIGRAAWRLDGFVSLDAAEEGGMVETVPLELSGNRLIVNADASKGHVAVEVLDEDGKTLPGYSADDCIAMKNDAIRHAVKWKEHDRLPNDRLVRLRFWLKNASLYSYRVQSESGD